MVLAYYFKTYFKGKSKEETPLFNLSIKLEGWRGPFKDFNSFLYISRLAMAYTHLEGKCHVKSTGKIAKGSVEGLHTFEAEIDLYAKNHLHYGKRGRILSLQNSTTIKPQDLPKSPRYTLKGLYGTIPEKYRQDRLSKLNKLIGEFQLMGKEFNSIAKNKETRLKLLENKYRREISNQ